MQKINELILLMLAKHGLGLVAVKERDDFHPEANALLHTLSVIDRCSLFHPHLMIAALYHDLGKIATYRRNKNSYGHANTSAWIVIEDRELIEAAGVDFNMVYFVVKNHITLHHNPDSLKFDTLTDQKYLPFSWIFGKCDNMTEDLLTEPEMEQLWLGKRVHVTTSDGDVVTGVCNFVGVNEFFGCKQITVDRSPLRIKYFSSICLERK